MTGALRATPVLLALICSGATSAAAAAPQEPGPVASTDVRRLYESADYEQAMRVVDTLLANQSTAADQRRLLQRYRALCLLAVGRTDDAETTIEALLRTDPLFVPDGDMPPRLTAMVNQARERMARSLVTGTYERGRDRFQNGDVEGAGADMTTVIAMIDDATLHLGDDAFFAPLRLLADGFKTLSLSKPDAVREPSPPTTASDNRATPAAAELSGASVAGAPASSTADLGAPVATLSPAGGRTGTTGAAGGFVAPRAIAQPLPRFNPATGNLPSREGEIAVDVAVDGSVTAARMTVSISPVFDASLVEAAKRWRYTPATRLGVPVAYTTRVRVVVAER
jgi:hypothetical protein